MCTALKTLEKPSFDTLYEIHGSEIEKDLHTTVNHQ